MSSAGPTGFLGIVLSGLRLRCPSCGLEPMGKGRRLKESCDRCGWKFFRLGDGDWLVTWLVAYTVAALVVIIVWPILHFAASMSLMTEIIIVVALGAATVALLFPNCQGMSAAILYFLRVRWKE